MSSLWKDVVYSLRSLRQHPAFAITAMLTLALGIGASTAIFSVVNAVLLRPLPYREADRLVLIWGDMRARNVTDFPFSPANFLDLKRQNTSFEDIAAVTPPGGSISIRGETPEAVQNMGVTPNILRVLGHQVLHGRDFTDADATPAPQAPPPAPGQAPAPQAAPAAPPPPAMVILNHAFWQRRFGGDPNVIGTSVELGGGTGQIIGVLRPGFEVLFPPNTNIEAHPDMLSAVPSHS